MISILAIIFSLLSIIINIICFIICNRKRNKIMNELAEKQYWIESRLADWLNNKEE